MLSLEVGGAKRREGSSGMGIGDLVRPCVCVCVRVRFSNGVVAFVAVVWLLGVGGCFWGEVRGRGGGRGWVEKEEKV